jgi:hypothetical protein
MMGCVESAIRDYLKARGDLLGVSRQYPEELGGNDNIIGRIGEYLAIKYLRAKGRIPRKTKRRAQKGYDLVDGKRRISVKLLTDENQAQRGERLREPWDELLLISLDTKTLTYRVGHIQKKQFARARRKNRTWSKRPVVKKSMLGGKGLIGRYGTVTDMLTFGTDKRFGRA